MAANACWGIEIGAGSIKALKLETDGEGKCKVADYSIVQHPKVLSTPGIDPNDVIRVSLGQLTSQMDFENVPVAVSIPGHSGFARFAKLPPVEPGKVGAIVEFEARQQIPFPLEQVEWDYQTFVTPDSPEVEVGIFAVTKERVNERLQMLEDVGITPSFVALSPIAAYNALAYDLDFGPKTPGTIIVDIGTTSTDLVIATPGRMWVRTFPLGGHNFTEALVNQFQLTYAKAEKLKKEAQDTKHARQVFAAMRPVFTDLAQDIQRSIGYFQSLHKDAELSRVIGIGNTWRLPGLRKYLKQQLGMDVYRIESFKKIGKGAGASAEEAEEGQPAKTVDPNDKSAVFEDASLGMSTAYGLALQGLGLNAVGGNLMPTAVLRKTMWKEKVKWFGLAAGIAAAAGAVLFINPLRSKMAISGKVAPEIIRDALNASTRIKSEADAAGITQAGEPDLRAGALAQLEENRAVFNYMTADIAEIFRAAEKRRETWAEAVKTPGGPDIVLPDGPPLALLAVNTKYMPPQGEGGPAMGPDGLPIAGGGGVSPEVDKHPSIEVIAQLGTTMPEARRFFIESVVRWLRETKVRKDRPYEIYFSDGGAGFTVTERQVASAGSENPAGLDDQRAADREARGGGASGGTGRTGTVRRGGLGSAAPPPGEGGLGEGGGRGRQMSGSENIESMAPLDIPKESVVPETGQGIFRWYMVFKPPAAPAEGEAGVEGEAGDKKATGGGS